MISDTTISKIYKTIKIYDKNLCNNRFLILGKNKKTYLQGIEIYFDEKSFQHLMGIKTKSAKDFYNNCLNKKFDYTEVEDFHNCKQKLNVANTAFDLTKNGKMYGKFNSTKFDMQTDFVLGNVNWYLGFVKSSIHKGLLAFINEISKSRSY